MDRLPIADLICGNKFFDIMERKYNIIVRVRTDIDFYARSISFMNHLD